MKEKHHQIDNEKESLSNAHHGGHHLSHAILFSRSRKRKCSWPWRRLYVKSDIVGRVSITSF